MLQVTRLVLANYSALFLRNFMTSGFGLVVMEGDSRLRGLEFESRYHLLDGKI